MIWTLALNRLFFRYICTEQRITFFLLICGIFYINILMENGVRRRNFPIFSASCKILFSELRRIIVILEQAPHHRRSSISASRCEIKYLRLQITWNECCFTNNFMENKYILFFVSVGEPCSGDAGSWTRGACSQSKTIFHRYSCSFHGWVEF